MNRKEVGAGHYPVAIIIIMRKEKFIKERHYKTSTYFTVQFNYRDRFNNPCSFSKTINSADYRTVGEALNEACRIRDSARAELMTAGLPSKKQVTLNQLWEDYGTIFKDHMTATTYKRKTSEYQHIARSYGSWFIQDITEIQIYDSLGKVAKTGSDALIARVMDCWRNLFKVAKIERLITDMSVLEDIVPPVSKKQTDKRNQIITAEDFDTIKAWFLASGRNDSERWDKQTMVWAFETMAYTGMRTGEAYALHKDDVDLANGVISVNHSQNAEGDEVKTKTASSRRLIPIIEPLKKILVSAMALSKSKYVFVDSNGRNLRTQKVGDVCLSASKQTGIDFHPYMLRHMFSTELDKVDTSLKTRMELMGHVNVQTAMHYPNSDMEQKREALRIVQDRTKSSENRMN